MKPRTSHLRHPETSRRNTLFHSFRQLFIESNLHARSGVPRKANASLIRSAQLKMEADNCETMTGRRLKHLGFVRLTAVSALVFVSRLYDRAKRNCGPLRSAVATVEGAVTAVVGPVYEKLKPVPEDLLVFADRKVDEATHKFDEHAPPFAKRIAWEVHHLILVTAEKAQRLVNEAQMGGPHAALHYAAAESKQVLLDQSVKVWIRLNKVQPVHLVVEMIVPTAAHWSKRYNHRRRYGATSAPPPTPSTLPTAAGTDSVAAADFLSRLIHRLPPVLSLPPGDSPTTTDNSPNSSAPAAVHAAISSVSWSDEKNASFFENLSSASSAGFFQMTGHPVSSELALSAESESLALFDLPVDQKELYFPKNWPFGYERDEDDDRLGEWFCLDSLCSSSAESSELKLESLRELALTMEKVGREIIEWLSGAIGFENPVKENPARVSSLMWISKGCSDEGHEGAVMRGGFYPFVVGLSYQIRTQKYSLLADSGRVTVSPEVGALMVATGDIAQVWSNGKLQKVRGRPVACGEGPEGDSSKSSSRSTITMSLLVSLPLESTVSPLLPLEKIVGHDQDDDDDEEEEEEEEEDISNASDRGKRRDGEEVMFRSFSFEDYAWRVYHERLIVSSPKDPLDGYRITNT